jgi:hypothetical protein
MNRFSLLILIFGSILINYTITGQGAFTRIKPIKGLAGPEAIFMVGNIGISVSGQVDSSASDYIRLWKRINNKWSSEIIDTVGYLYGSELIVYKCDETSEYLALCASDNEFYTNYIVYYINDNILTKAGPLPIQNDCNNLENLTYPINKLKFQNNNNEIIIKPLTPFLYDIGDNNWQKFKPSDAYLIIDKSTKRIIMHKR